MTPAEREQWHLKKTAEFRIGLRFFILLILPFFFIFLGIVSVAPSYLWLYGIALGLGALVFSTARLIRTPPGTLMPQDTNRASRPSARQHYVACIIGSIFIMLICAWSGYVAL